METPFRLPRLPQSEQVLTDASSSEHSHELSVLRLQLERFDMRALKYK
jgi:hypothetical protein